MVSKKFIAGILLLGIALLAAVSAAGCISTGESADDRPTAVCTNGIFIGTYENETGVVAFKGIPYAKQPIGDLRWKAPVKADASSEVFDAVNFGPSAVQTIDDDEPASLHEKSEACLTLDIWTQNMNGDKKPVMVFIHGGSYGWGCPLSIGKYLYLTSADLRHQIQTACLQRVF